MTSRDFCYWLQGLFELTEIKELNQTQVQVVKDHLKMVFNASIAMPGLKDLILPMPTAESTWMKKTTR